VNRAAPLDRRLEHAIRRLDDVADVELWCCSLDLPTASVQDSLALLSDDERTRADRYRFRVDQHRFVAARAFLRTTIGYYLSLRPGRVRFVYGEFGKPALPPALNAEGLEFNLSHSDALAVLGVARRRRLGVDVERVRPLPDLHDIASRFFASSEASRLRALPTDLQELAFYCCWTRKEAFLKALGHGLAHPLDSFAVSLHATDARLLDVRDDPVALSRWALHHVNAGRGHVAALAVESRGLEVSDRPRTSPTGDARPA
jgi:4'-phosphopantetheinyl transferase